MMMETRQNNVQIQRPTFLPMLCSRPSIKNVTLPTKSNQEVDQKADPLSPKISCIGQVKRSNKIVGFPTTTSSSSSSITPGAHNRYFKLKRLFSRTNLSFSGPATTTIKTSRGRIKKEEIKGKMIALIDAAELDPPLPVVRKMYEGAAGDKAAESLWKRRSSSIGGVSQLRSLEIQLNGAHHLKVTTV